MNPTHIAANHPVSLSSALRSSESVRKILSEWIFFKSLAWPSAFVARQLRAKQAFLLAPVSSQLNIFAREDNWKWKGVIYFSNGGKNNYMYMAKILNAWTMYISLLYPNSFTYNCVFNIYYFINNLFKNWKRNKLQILLISNDLTKTI